MHSPAHTTVAGSTSDIKRLVVLLVAPTKYGRHGQPLRFWKGVLPSNSLAVMHAVTQQAFRHEMLSQLECVVECRSDIIWRERVNKPEKLVKQYLDGQTLVVAGLVGVQTNQFPRAVELAERFKAAGATVVIGGFHVSGSISTMHDGIANADPKRANVPCPHVMPPEVKALMDEGIIVCHGEAEEIWAEILWDIVQGTPKQLYRGGKPNILNAPMPQYPRDYFRGFAAHIGTMDTGRGCPFACAFCTIINVQGRDPRWREPQNIIRHVKQQCEQHGRAMFFFVDDNFARNKCWGEILDGLILLRKRGYKISFMIEADLVAYHQPGFVEKLAAAGCTQIFLGMESVNRDVLRRHRKFQNDPEDYRHLCELLHAHGIAVHVGYIIGWEDDTVESVLRDVETIKALGVDQASFFILTPLPGSEDHIRLYMDPTKRRTLDPDFNKYDSFSAVMPHPNMAKDQLTNLLRRCFRRFFTAKQMIAVLRRLPKESRWGMLRNQIWYYNAVWGEDHHPMLTGFWSRRSRTEIRPGWPVETRWQFCRRRFWFYLRYLGIAFRMFYIFQHVYFQTQLEPSIARALSGRLRRGLAAIPDWCRRTFGKHPSRTWVNKFWIRYGRQKWDLFWRLDWHLRMIPFAVTEVVYSARFAWAMFGNYKNLLSR